MSSNLADLANDLIGMIENSAGLIDGGSKGLPDGGTPDRPNPTRADDAGLIKELAVRLVPVTTNLRQANDEANDDYQGALDATQHVLQAVAQSLYQSGLDSICQGMRRWLNLPPTSPGDYTDVLIGLGKVFDLKNLPVLVSAADAVNDRTQSWSDFGVSADDELEYDVEGEGVTNGVAVSAAAAVSDLVKEIWGTVDQELKAGLKTAAKGLAAEEKAEKNTSAYGHAAHAVIEMHYCLTHPCHEVLVDRWLVGIPCSGDLPRTGEGLELIASALATAKVLRQGLKGDAGVLKQPDILDATAFRVYEIKPIGGAMRGLAQLYTYIFLLNFKGAKFDRPDVLKLIAAQGPTQSTTNGLANPFLAGDWQPAHFYFIPPDALIGAVLAVPGLILYARYTVSLPELKPKIIAVPALLMVLGLAIVVAAPEVAVGTAAVAISEAAAPILAVEAEELAAFISLLALRFAQVQGG